MPRKKIIIVDPPDRRSVPAAKVLSENQDVLFLIPVRRLGIWHKLAKPVVKLFISRRTIGCAFIEFSDVEELANGVVSFVEKTRPDILLGFSERSTALLISIKERLPASVYVPFGTIDDFNTLNNKFCVAEIAQAADIPVPDFVKVERPEDIEQAVSVGFPAVLKCCLASGVNESLRYCHSRDDLFHAYNELSSMKTLYCFFPRDQMIVQRFVSGKIYDGNFFVKNGEIIAGMTQQRIWTIPLEGGAGVYNRTVNLPILYEYAKRFFKSVSWTGPVNMEYIRDDSDGSYRLIEINPRFWGTLALSLKAGLDFPQIAVDSFGNCGCMAFCEWENSVDYRWLLQETLLAEIMMGKPFCSTMLRHVGLAIKRKDNFAYGVGGNIMLSIPFFASSFSYKIKGGKIKSGKGICEAIFS